jgi:hypothetical protein
MTENRGFLTCRLDSIIESALRRRMPGLFLLRTAAATIFCYDSGRQLGRRPTADLDGRLDLVYEAVRYSQDGTGAAFSDVFWQRNTDATGAPRLSKPCRLTSLPALEMATGLSVGDWDSDRWPDLIVAYIRGKVEAGSYRYVAAGIRVYPRRFASPREPASG